MPAPPLGRGGDPSTTLSPSSRGPPASAAALALLTRPGAAGPHVAGRSQRPEGAAGPGARSQSPEPRASAEGSSAAETRARPRTGCGGEGRGSRTHARARKPGKDRAGHPEPEPRRPSGGNPAGWAPRQGKRPGRGSALPCLQRGQGSGGGQRRPLNPQTAPRPAPTPPSPTPRPAPPRAARLTCG